MKRFVVLTFASMASMPLYAAVSFDRDIAPILSTHCAECHGPNVQKGKVSLTQRAHLLGESSWKQVITPGNPDTSPLIEAVSGADPEMPKKGPKLSPEEIAKLRQWIADGAAWPDGFTLKEALHGSSSLWSLQPIKPSSPPPISNPESQISNPIDAFIQARLANSNIAPAPPADPRTLIRRLTFDLLGLPPTPEEVSAFEAEFIEHPISSIQNLVTRLLSSPHYGERWARHWLDIAHYADTHGFERDQKRENAWPYRDWVIRAFNNDVPYDQFLRAQIAGDVIAPQDRDSVIATGFLAAGPWDFVGQMETPSPVLKRQARADDLDDMVTQVITSTLGLTINCARCHNHKLDPIPQEDYYRLVACFAGVKRGERDLIPSGGLIASDQRMKLTMHAFDLRRRIARLVGETLDLADIVGGRDGRARKKQSGIGFDPSTGKPITFQQGFIENAQPNVFRAVIGKEGEDQFPFIDGVVIPDGSHPVPITTTGITVSGVPPSSGRAWDAIRNGPVKSQASTKVDGVDYSSEHLSLLGLHANAAITFDLQPARKVLGNAVLRFTATVGYGGSQPGTRADFHVFVDGRLVAQCMKFGKADGGTAIDIILEKDARFLTLMSTDGGDGIGHDQVFFGDPKLTRAEPPQPLTAQQRTDLIAWRKNLELTRSKLSTLPKWDKLYATVSEPPPVTKVLARGNPEAILQDVTPGALSCLSMMPPDIGDNSLPEGQRRRKLVDWIVDPRNPLTARVMVNRLWHHHFGRGLVDTPSDFGNGGGKPSHPELLDWLATEFMRSGWSIKHMHRLIVTSETYRRSSTPESSEVVLAHSNPQSAIRNPQSTDSSNRLLARTNPRRLDAESLRDAVLSVSGCLNPASGGPGYQDFEYQDAYAPIYKHVTADKPELWRRSIYRFIVRTTPQRFLTTLDCPDPANLTPARLTTTTALQSLALMNNEFMLQQSAHFAARVQREAGSDIAAQIRRAFALAFQRQPDADELSSSIELVHAQSLSALCRVLFNTNEFVHID